MKTPAGLTCAVCRWWAIHKTKGERGRATVFFEQAAEVMA